MSACVGRASPSHSRARRNRRPNAVCHCVTRADECCLVPSMVCCLSSSPHLVASPPPAATVRTVSTHWAHLCPSSETDPFVLSYHGGAGAQRHWRAEIVATAENDGKPSTPTR